MQNCQLGSDFTISQNDNIETNEIEEQNTNEPILSIHWNSGKLGAAAYFMDSAEIQILNDIVDIRPDFQICKHLFHEIQPATIICSKTVSAVFLDQIKSLIDFFTNSDCKLRVKLELLSSKIFNYETGKKRVLDIKMMNKSVNMLEENQQTFIQSLINMDYQKMITALGGLLFYLDTYISRITLQIPSENVLSVKILNLENIVWMNQETYIALEIFSSVHHPTFKRSTTRMKLKENFSIYNIFNRCCSKIGSNQLKTLFNHPTKDIMILKKRHEVIDFFLKPENEIVLNNLRDCLKNVFNVTTILLRITGIQATPLQWKRLYKTTNSSIMIGEICKSLKDKATFFEEVANSLEESLYTINHLIESLMDFEASVEQGRFVVKSSKIPELDEVKEKHKDLPRMMKAIAQRELQDLPIEIPSCSLIYFPEIGYLLGIPVWKENLNEGDLILPNMVFKFMLNNVAHYKTARCVEMDSVLGDSHLIILKHETEIMFEVAEYIRNNVSAITKILHKIRILDCLLSFSIIAQEFNLVKPNLTIDHQISIIKGRHMLLQLCVNSFIPNDYHSSIENSLVKIFTGPNSSGKSVYLKQVALIVYLAHIGSFVPAEKATIGLIDYIHTRIQTTESVSTRLSSFMLDLRQMYSALYNSTPNTLVVIDEFGKGTEDIDGLSLLASCVQHFIDRKENCPHVLVSTHFHSLFSLLRESLIIKSQTLDFVLQNEEVTFLYKVKDGSTSSSFAINAAKSIGFGNYIIDRAKQVLECMQLGIEILPLNYKSGIQTKKNTLEYIQRGIEILPVIYNNEIETENK